MVIKLFMFLCDFLCLILKNRKIACQKPSEKITCDCDFNNFATTTLGFLFLSYAIIY